MWRAKMSCENLSILNLLCALLWGVVEKQSFVQLLLLGGLGRFMVFTSIH